MGFSIRHVHRLIGVLALSAEVGCGNVIDWEREPFPEQLTLGRVVASCQNTGLIDGILVAYVELAPGVAQTIQKQGLAYFEGKTAGRGDKIDLQPWAPSPMIQKENGQVDSAGGTVYAWPMSGCKNDDIAPNTTTAFIREYDAGRAYYSTFNNGEGLLVVAPKLGMAAYYYNG